MLFERRQRFRALACGVVLVSLFATSADDLQAQATETLWEQILRHAPEEPQADGTSSQPPALQVRRIHRESSTEDILAALDSPEAPDAVWDLAVERLKTEARGEELAALLHRCLADDHETRVHRICAFHEANRLARAGEFDEAAALLESALAYQSLGDILGVMALNLAELNAAQGDFGAARTLYYRLANLQQQTLPARLGLAMLALKEGRLHEARTQMEPIVAQPDAERVLLGDDTFYVPEGDVHLVELLFSMITGDGERARTALENWSETPSAQASENQNIWQQRQRLPDTVDARIQRLGLPSECYPTLAAPGDRGRRLLVACVDQNLYEYRVPGGSEPVTDATIITNFSEIQSPVADIEPLGPDRLRVLFEMGVVTDFVRREGEWRPAETIDLGIEQALAEQLLTNDSVLLLHISGNTFSVVPIAQDVGVGALLSLGHGRSIPTVEFGSSGEIGVSTDSNQAIVFDADSRAVLQTMTLNTPYELNRIALSPDEQTLAVQTEGKVSLYSLQNYRLIDLWRIADSSGIGSLRWSPDGATLFATTNNALYMLQVEP